MTSVLLLTLESWLHCQPGVMLSVSLLPVANVVSSPVAKPPLVVVLKSCTKRAAVNPVGSAGLVAPAEVNMLSQSFAGSGLGGGLLVVAALASPSSWKARSWTAI